MRGMRLVIGLFAMSAAFGAMSACSHAGEAGGELAPQGAVGLHVQNDNFLDVDVFAVSQGMRTRLGTVTGSSSANFMINPSMATQDLRIVATPIGGMGQASTGSILVQPGQTIDFRVGSILSNSSVYIKQ